MAGEITTPTLAGPGLMPIERYAPLAFNNDEDDANTGAVDCVAAPGASKAIYLTHITISGRVADIAITIQDGDGTVLYGPIQMQDSGSGTFTKDWVHPLKLVDNKALSVYASAASAFTLYGEYFIGKSPMT